MAWLSVKSPACVPKDSWCTVSWSLWMGAWVHGWMGAWVHGWMNGGGAANALLDDPKNQRMIGFPCCLCLKHEAMYLCPCLAGRGYVKCVRCSLSLARPLLCTEGSVWGSFYKAGRNGSRGRQGLGQFPGPPTCQKPGHRVGQSVLGH